VRERVDDLVPVFLEALDAAGAARGTNPKLHVRDTDRAQVPADWFDAVVPIARADGPSDEPRAELIETSRLGVEWEWEDSPEVTLVIVDDVDEAADLFNRYSPHFVLSLLSEDAAERSRVEGSVDAPFVGDGFTRWVDGQYALGTPELGLSNWQLGRLLGAPGSCPVTASTQSRSRPAAQAVSSCRLDSCSLRSTAETWVSTVLTEMCSRGPTSL
jgi:glutamate-5-semialdehyde dehydrogenase